MLPAAARRARKPLYALLTPLVLAALACNLGQSLAPTAVAVETRTPPPEATATLPAAASPTATLAPALTPTAAVTAGPVEEVSLLEAVLAQIRSGEVERGAAIAGGLRYFVGEAGDEAFGPQTTITSVAGTGVMRMARHYLETGDDPAARAEIERLLNLIQPPLERLHAYAAPETAGGAGPVRAGPHRGRPARQAEEELCRELWAESFPPGTDAICFRYATREIGGHTHTVYYPSYWPAGDPRREYLDLYLEALETSLAVYNTYGPNPVAPVHMVFTELAALREGVRDERIYAMAVPDSDVTAPPKCYMGVFPTAVAQAPAAFKQTIAHELFHCYQYTNLTTQERGPDPADNAWWVEGSAEFFGNVAYPNVNDEWQYIGTFDRRSRGSTLFDFTYHNFMWFQYLAHGGGGLGTAGVLALLRAMPNSGGAAEQEAALARQPGMEDLFHNFARAYLDRALLDTDGSVLPVDPARGGDTTFGLGGGEEFFTPLPFQLSRYQLLWTDETSFTLSPSTIGVGRSAVRDPATPGLWTALPETVGTACAGAQHLLLVTTTEAGDADPHELRVAYTGEEAGGCDGCLVGTWALDNGSYINFLGGLVRPDDALQYTHATGTTLFNFKDDGVSSTQHEGFVVEGVIHQETLDGGALDLPVQMALSGGSEANYTAEAGLLTFSEGEYNVTADMTMNGVSLNDWAFRSEDFGLGAGEARYTCIEDSLTYRPIFPDRETARAMAFVRVEEP